ncbi:MAG TPA: hypothetical protein VJ697_11880 [Nitrososphaeraceae archaeon]|nr:hypothetical protein [Nitrososphaeraceae archaeon]
MTELDDALRENMAFIVHIEHRPFCYKDFLYFEVNGKQYRTTHGTFRNKISQLMQNNEVEVNTKSNPTFYTLKGYRFGNGKSMTDNHTEVNNNISAQKIIHHPLYQILEGTAFGERTIHNLHSYFNVRGIYNVLNNLKLNEDHFQKSNGISFTYFIDQFTIIVTIYPNDTSTVVIGCSENPILLDFEGINMLSIALCKTEEKLSKLLINSKVTLPIYKDWTITLWHIGKDSLSEYSKEMFHCKWDLAEKIALRIYSKELRNKKKVRIELQQNPNISIENLQTAIMKKILE